MKRLSYTEDARCLKFKQKYATHYYPILQATHTHTQLPPPPPPPHKTPIHCPQPAHVKPTYHALSSHELEPHHFNLQRLVSSEHRRSSVLSWETRAKICPMWKPHINICPMWKPHINICPNVETSH